MLKGEWSPIDVQSHTTNYVPKTFEEMPTRFTYVNACLLVVKISFANQKTAWTCAYVEICIVSTRTRQHRLTNHYDSVNQIHYC